MDFAYLFDLLLHVDEHLLSFVTNYGTWVYVLLFVILFCETGLVVTPFLPGDSLLFATGAICASTAAHGGPSITLMIPLLIFAAILGDAVNYRIGYTVGPGFLEQRLNTDNAPTGLMRFVKRSHLERTRDFYERYGGKTIVFARFVPIVRTFAPFMAGVGQMQYRRFFVYNVVGAIAWVMICTLAGYFFGELPFVKENFELVVLAIIFISVLPIVFESLRGASGKKTSPGTSSAG